MTCQHTLGSARKNWEKNLSFSILSMCFQFLDSYSKEITVWNQLYHSIYLSFIKCTLNWCYSTLNWQKITLMPCYKFSQPTWACFTAWLSGNGNFMRLLHFGFTAWFVVNGLQPAYRVHSPPVLRARLVQLVLHHPEEPEWN